MSTSKQRRAAEQRRLRRQAQRRQQQLARRRRLNIIFSVVGTLVIIGVVITLIAVTNGSGSTKSGAATSSTAPASKPSTSAASPTTTPTSKPATKPATTSSTSAKPSSSAPATASTSAAAPGAAVTKSCSYPLSGTAARRVSIPPTKAQATGTVAVRLATSQGAMTFTLDRATAPCTVNSFVSLARQKYFDATSCHRLVTKSIFVLQCGDPTGTGRGGPGYKFNDELTGKEVYARGVLAMANGGPNTNGSQFFIVDKDTELGPAYTIFGKVSAGLGVVDKVYQAGTADGSTDGPPKLKLTFRTVTVG